MGLRIWAMHKKKVDESMWDVWKWVEMRRGEMGWVNFKLSHWRSSPIHNKDNHNHTYTHDCFLPPLFTLLYNYKIPHLFTSLLFFPPGVSQNVYQSACFNIWFRVKKMWSWYVYVYPAPPHDILSGIVSESLNAVKDVNNVGRSFHNDLQRRIYMHTVHTHTRRI